MKPIWSDSEMQWLTQTSVPLVNNHSGGAVNTSQRASLSPHTLGSGKANQNLASSGYNLLVFTHDRRLHLYSYINLVYSYFSLHFKEMGCVVYFETIQCLNMEVGLNMV